MERTLIGKREWRDPRVRLGYALAYLAFAAGAVLTVVPFAWMVLSSLKPAGEIFRFPAEWIPSRWDFSTYAQALERVPFARYCVNSLVYCAGVVAGQLLLSAVAAYSLSKLKPRYSRFWLLLILSTLMIPFETILIPLYLQMRAFPLGWEGLPHVNLINTMWALILPNVVSAFNVFVLKGFFDRLPNDVIFAARIDGASEWGIFARLALPLSRPIMTVLGIFSFILTWNSFFWPLIALNEPRTYTLMLGVQKLIETGEPWNVIMAAVTLTTLPTVLVFLMFQRWIMRGIVFTGLQG